MRESSSTTLSTDDAARLRGIAARVSRAAEGLAPTSALGGVASESGGSAKNDSGREKEKDKTFDEQLLNSSPFKKLRNESSETHAGVKNLEESNRSLSDSVNLSSAATLSALQALAAKIAAPGSGSAPSSANAGARGPVAQIDLEDPDAPCDSIDDFFRACGNDLAKILTLGINWTIHRHICKQIATEPANAKFKFQSDFNETSSVVLDISVWWKVFAVCKEKSLWRRKFIAMGIPNTCVEKLESQEQMLVTLVAWMVRNGSLQAVPDSGIQGPPCPNALAPPWPTRR